MTALAYDLRSRPLAREAAICASIAAVLAALLAWLGPPGADLAAHAYQRALYVEHGLALWNNFWYAGRYSFVTYSLLYYPLAALLGIRPLAVLTIATAALAFAVVIGREWGSSGRWSARSFAVVWAGMVISAAFPFALGASLSLFALWALQARRHWRFAVLAALTIAASPLAFLLLALVLVGVAIARIQDRRSLLAPALTIVGFGAVEVVLWRVFPDNGRYPFSTAELAATCVFCTLGLGVTWRVERARPLFFFCLVYLCGAIAAYVVPSTLGENIARLRFAAIPIAVLCLSLRAWRPRLLALVVLGLAISWNVSPLAASFIRGASDPAVKKEYWQPFISYLHANLDPSYRVEVVDTQGHWGAVYLPQAGIPLARGWFRQDDFPQNSLLYDEFGRVAYARWLRALGVRYVVLTSARPDYSARGEADLLRSGRSGLRVALQAPTGTLYEVPEPRPIVTGPGRARVVSLTQTRIVLHVYARGVYRLAVRYSPYWRPTAGCVSRGPDGMLRVTTLAPGWLALTFDVSTSRALKAFAGEHPVVCRKVSVPPALRGLRAP